MERLISQHSPGFLVLVSSLAGVVGRPGQVDYCAANAFLDAFAREHGTRTGIHTVAIDWGEWRGVGMAARSVFAGAPELSNPNHPLLGQRKIAPDGSEVYTTRFRVDTHWVLDEHRLVGMAVIPGTPYIEMVRAALAERAGGRCIEISDLYFLAPLAGAQSRDPRGATRPPSGGGWRRFLDRKRRRRRGFGCRSRTLCLWKRAHSGRGAARQNRPPRTDGALPTP